MATTATWGIVYPTTANAVTPLATQFANLANSTDTALTTLRTVTGAFRGLDSAKGAASIEGRTWYSTDTDILYYDTGSAWVARTQPWTTQTAANDWTANSGGNSPQVSLNFDIVSWRGGMFGGTSGNFATTLPTWARPARDARIPVILSDNTTIGRVRVATSGQVFLSGSISVDAQFSWSVLA